MSNDKTRAAIMALPDGTIIGKVYRDGQLLDCPLHVRTADLKSFVAHLEGERDRYKALINTPHTHDWLDAVPLEAAHQLERWPSEHDDGKTPFDWFWLIGYLSQKAAASAVAGDVEKAKHHTISTGAALLNWFRRLTGDDESMRPGIQPPSAVKEKA